MPIVYNSKLAMTDSTPSWLKSGQQSKTAYQNANFAAQKAAEESKLMRRFYLLGGEEKVVTFLDGDLDSDGILSFMSFNEHRVQLGPKKWETFICVAETEICPLCNAQNRADYAGVFSVIVHTPYTIQTGQNAGKVLGDRQGLYVCGLRTLRVLQTLATKWGGLSGWRTEITRPTDKDPRVGSMFQKLERCEDLTAKYGELATPADYGKEIPYYTADELIKAGVGLAPTGPGFANKGMSVGAASDHM